MNKIERDLRERLVQVGKILYETGLVYRTAGNISARIPGTRTCLIKPSGFKLRHIQPENFLVVNIDTLKVIVGEGRPSIETPLHTVLYRKREDIGGVVHSHSHYATVLATCGIELKPIGIFAWLVPEIAKGVKVAKFAPPGTSQSARNLAEALGDGNAVLMPHHGVSAIGKTVEYALTVAQTVEALARFTYDCLCIGKPQLLPEQVLNDLLQEDNGLSI